MTDSQSFPSTFNQPLSEVDPEIAAVLEQSAQLPHQVDQQASLVLGQGQADAAAVAGTGAALAADRHHSSAFATVACRPCSCMAST